MGGPRVLVAHQPAYLPWPGYFSRLLDGVDELVLLDHVQFSERGWQHRNLVRNPAGPQPLRLTVPVRRRFGQSITDVEVADEPWAARHWRTLTQTYARAPYWGDHRSALQHLYERPWQRLAELNHALLQLLLDAFRLPVQLVNSSALRPRGGQTAMLVDLCHRRDATVLRVGTGAAAYLDHPLLAEHRIRVETATYTHPRYGSARGWMPGLSALDLLLHEGPNAPSILRAGARTNPKATA
ncbi:WbqC family protein [Streptomyces pinistramenti]|uniref:WbqC family protein n=1 Tax=Streptomyces pinistramenti TaxID=2884812 RepID=UPI001D090674|nr:WbqC family protein [Streptomyces pinistramenti]MCB5908099.1 WbqC family protein [Streptomyces pinistramenti]